MISVLQLKEIDAGYGKIKVLDKLNLNITENKIYCLLGPNGSGKTTTFRIISNTLMPWSGIIEMEDIILNKDNNYHSKSLDEPFSGLDPEAVKNGRKIIKELSSYSYIVISTHVLLIADQIADTVGIIYRGKVMLEDSVEKIKKKLKIGTIKIMAEGDVDYALSALNYDYEHKEGYYYVKVHDFDKETPVIVDALTKENCKVKEVKISDNVLEEIYLELTRGN